MTISWVLSRTEGEFLWDLLMGYEDRGPAIRSSKEDLARELAELCGFDHDKTLEHYLETAKKSKGALVRPYSPLLPGCTCEGPGRLCLVHGVGGRAQCKRNAQRAIKDGRLTQEDYDVWLAKYPKPTRKRKWSEG